LPRLCLHATLSFSLVLPPLCVFPLQYPDLLLEHVIRHAQNTVDLHCPDLCRIAVGCRTQVLGATAPSVTELVALVADHLRSGYVSTRLRQRTCCRCCSWCLDQYTHCLSTDSLSRWRKETFVLLDARALLKTQSNLLGAAHPVVEVFWIVHEHDKLMDAAANTLLVKQDEHLVAKSCVGGNEAERLVECCDAGVGTGLGQFAQLLLCMLLEHHGDKELPKALFELIEVLCAVGAIKAVPVVEW
jgi:hypothetical protein